MCPSGGMADAAVSKTVVSRRASSTLASGTSFSVSQGGPLGRLFHSPPKKGRSPKKSTLSFKCRSCEKTVLRVRKLQWPLTPAAREDETARWHPPDWQPWTPWVSTKKEGTRLMRETRPFVKDAAKKRSVIPLSQPSASSQWRQSSSRPLRRERWPGRTEARQGWPAARGRARCRPSRWPSPSGRT